MTISKVTVAMLATSLALTAGAASGSRPLEVGRSGTEGSSGVDSLALRAVLAVDFGRGGICPPGEAATVKCDREDGVGLVPGLGQVSSSSVSRTDDSTGCDDPFVGYPRILPTTARFEVAGKGAIDFALSGTAEGCDAAEFSGLPYSVTGGTGAYGGAAGTGIVSRGGFTPGGVARVIWTGTLVVPGHEFDITAPRVSGPLQKSVRAAPGKTTARVTFRFTARDEVDGVVPVECSPPSGTYFPLGGTWVTCSVTDWSGNRVAWRFRVRVRRGVR
jgi:hypothetical protein